MRPVVECQRELIRLKFLSPTQPDGTPSDDGRAGQLTFAAFNRFLASKGKPPVDPSDFTLAAINAALFPEPAPAKSNPLTKWLTDLAIKQAVSYLKGLPQMKMLSTGYNTYILAVLILLSAAAETFLGIDVPGFSMGIGEAVAVGLALITGRAGAKADVAKATGQ